MGRWISPDDIEYLDSESVNGLNLYCYCLNNPIMYADHSGHFPILSLILGTIIGVASGSISVISQAVISPILNTLLAQGVTDVMTLGTTAGATYLGYLTGKLVVKGIKAVGKEFKKNLETN